MFTDFSQYLIMIPPVLLFLIGFFLVRKEINKAVGILLCVLSPLIFLFLFWRVEFYSWILVPLVYLIVGVLLVISGIMAKGKKVLRFSLPVVLIAVGVFVASFYPVWHLVSGDDGTEVNANPSPNPNPYEGYPVTKAVYEQNKDELEMLLKNGADPNEVVDGKSVMKRIILSEDHDDTALPTDYEAIKLLLDFGYDIDEADENGVTLLMYATTDLRGEESEDNINRSDRQLKLTQFLVGYGADVNARDDNGRTALMWACNYRGRLSGDDMDIENLPYIPFSEDYYQNLIPAFNFDQIKYLIDNGADIQAMDDKGYTALDYFRFAVEEGAEIESRQAIEELLQSVPLTYEEALDKASGYYPEGVGFVYMGQESIRGDLSIGMVYNPYIQICHIFDVTYNERKVSGVAVGMSDGNMWFLDMAPAADDPEMPVAIRWINESAFGLPENPDGAPAENEPLIEVEYDKESKQAVLHFANLYTIPELGDKNQGSAIWDKTEKTLEINAIKTIGTVTGSPDGPGFNMKVNWKTNLPVIESVEFVPAPVFSNPVSVIHSEELLEIGPDQFIELAEYLKKTIEEMDY